MTDSGDSRLDPNSWFKNSPVPTDVRNALRADLKTVAPDETSRLESVLKKFSKQNMTEEQKRAIEIVQALDLVAKGIVRVASDSADTIQEFRGVVKQTVEVISSGVKCLAQAQASGRVGSLYELFSGKDQCNGAELSASERVFSAVELALGTPKVFHVLGTVGSSVLGVIIKGEKAAEAVKAGGKIVDSARKQGFGRVQFPRGSGASRGATPEGYVRVSRWIDEKEARIWMEKGATTLPAEVGANQRMYVTTFGAEKFRGGGNLRVDFEVPEAMLQQGGRPDWRQIILPQSTTPIYNVQINLP